MIPRLCRFSLVNSSNSIDAAPQGCHVSLQYNWKMHDILAWNKLILATVNSSSLMVYAKLFLETYSRNISTLPKELSGDPKVKLVTVAHALRSSGCPCCWKSVRSRSSVNCDLYSCTTDTHKGRNFFSSNTLFIPNTALNSPSYGPIISSTCSATNYSWVTLLTLLCVICCTSRSFKRWY